VTRSRSLASALSRSLAILGPMLLGGLAASCGNRNAGSADSARATAASKTIGVTLLTREDEFYRSLEDGLRKAAAAHGYKLLVQSGDRDLAKQQSQIDNFIVQKVDAIVVCPVDTKGIGPAIERANAAKIPVFTADIAAQGGSVVSHVASDNVAGGKLAAEYIAQAIGDSGQVGVIGENDVQTTIDRQQGFKDALTAHPKIALVAQLDGQGVRDRALKAADDLLQAHPNVAAIFAINDESAFGTLSAVQARKKKVVIVGYDAGPEARRDIATGTQLRADVAQQPGLIGQQTIDAIASLFAGRTPPAKIAVPVTMVNADSVKAESAAR